VDLHHILIGSKATNDREETSRDILGLAPHTFLRSDR
jgi:hypothetical protein